MNFENKYQIMKLVNQLNPDLSLFEKDDDILDPLYYIKGKKMLIKFINSDYKIIKIYFPISITKKDFYSIAYHYKSLTISNILLIHKNNILNEDINNY